MKTSNLPDKVFRLLKLLALCLALFACGGDGGDGEGGGDPYVYVSISSPEADATFTSSPAFFEGEASCPECPADRIGFSYAICDGRTIPSTAIDVAWKNKTTGDSGIASDAIRYSCGCSLLGCASYYRRVWSAIVPLAIGRNAVTVTATGVSGGIGTRSIGVTRLPESVPPRVSATDPSDGTTGVAVNATLTATFSEPLDPASVTSAALKVTYGGIQVPGSVTYSDRKVQFTPTTVMVASTLHTATVTTVIRDESGNALASDYVWTFTTGVSSDVVPPVVTDIVPADGTTCFPPDGTLTATFSELLDTRTVGPATFVLSGTAGAVSGSVSLNWDGVTALFSPYSQLGDGQTYTATLSGQIKDLAGNAIGTDRVWSFTTAPAGIGSWQSTSSAGAPTSRSGHTVVWTGTEMIVWGGSDGGSGLRLASGGRYDPATDAWTSMSPAPIARTQHVAVWTGTEMLAWGGFGTSTTALPSTGAIYSPTTDSWRAMSTTGAPSGRTGATAVWTGTEMIVWGGYGQGPVLGTSGPALGDGARYDPATDTWQPVSGTNAPEPRSGSSVVWTGSRMIVWGGNATSGLLNMGAAYDPATDTWQALPTLGAPSPRTGHSGTWTGSEMIIWGGSNSGTLNSGGRYDPTAGTWRSMPIDCAASPRQLHSAVWGGSELIVWGGVAANATVGGRFSPTAGDWRPMSVIGQPAATTMPPPAIWTGSEMIVWTGYGAGGAAGSGSRYSP